jgi:hypothetical protein
LGGDAGGVPVACAGYVRVVGNAATTPRLEVPADGRAPRGVVPSGHRELDLNGQQIPRLEPLSCHAQRSAPVPGPAVCAGGRRRRKGAAADG